MQIARAYIQNFRCIKSAEIYPTKSNVILGPNNVGKTAYLEALNLVLNPEISYRGKVIDENDFYQREYFPAIREKSVGTSDSEISVEESDNEEPEICGSDDEMDEEPEIAVPEIYIELTLCNLSIEDEDKFRENLVPWDKDECYVVDSTDEGEDPFDNAETAIRVFFKGWYDLEEDDFDYCTKFLPSYDMDHEECSIFSREQKRYIGFLIYRDFRALTRPVTLEPGQLFNRVLQSYGVTPHQFEKVLISVRNSLEPVNQESDFSEILDHFKNEIEKYLTLSGTKSSALEFDLTDRTRYQLKSTAQLQIKNEIYLPIQRSGAGTRSLTILSMLLMIMRKRGRGILVLEEPETFLFPHAQRRVIDEAILLASQIFVSTHSPFVLERMPIDGTGRIVRDESDDMYWNLLPSENIKKVNLYSKRLRQAHCEAIMGTGVVIVEGDSDRWWLNGASRLLNKYEYNGKPLEAFELLGHKCQDIDNPILMLKNARTSITRRIFYVVYGTIRAENHHGREWAPQ